MVPKKEIDASHPDVFVDQNRCILCGRCVNASRDVDGKTAFEFTDRGIHKKVAADSSKGLGGTKLAVTDKAADVCPVGCIIKKRIGFAVPVGKRLYDTKPIGSEISEQAKN
jgi:[NiFe] hydrogenase diaphorase moiety small subunit